MMLIYIAHVYYKLSTTKPIVWNLKRARRTENIAILMYLRSLGLEAGYEEMGGNSVLIYLR